MSPPRFLLSSCLFSREKRESRVGKEEIRSLGDGQVQFGSGQNMDVVSGLF